MHATNSPCIIKLTKELLIERSTLGMVMPLDPKTQPAEAERAELDRVVQALARWPRLSQLLRYMGDKLFSGQLDQITEYDIATEVLGRSKTLFNAAEDAIARVETHRLRKRLAAYYETDGKDHQVQITLPAGSYVPVFVHRHEEKPMAASVEPAPASPGLSTASEPDSHGNNTRRVLHFLAHHWTYSLLAACIVLGALGASLYYFHPGEAGQRSRFGGSAPPVSVAVPLPSAVSSGPIRILAGYGGPPRTDSAGNVWNRDQFFSGGGTWQRSSEVIARTSDPFIFEHSRTGDFSYSIPLKPGSYDLHLFFSTPSQSVTTFNVSIKGQYVLLGFDINSDAMGENIADERVFRDVSPEPDGLLRIGFTGAMGPPAVNAIEILPSVAHRQIPIRLIMQATPQTDSKGQVWHPDNYFMNGHLSNPRPLVDSPDPDLFGGERYGHFSYAIPVDVRDTYTVVLHFAEFYFTAAASGSNGRVFKVTCNGRTLLDNFDIFREAGSLHELAKTFRHLKPSAQGKLNLTFEPIVNNATVSGIEVLDEAQ